MKKSVIIFILANLAVMSIPFWAALPLNRQIASGKWRSQSKEDEAKLIRRKFDAVSALEIASDSENIGLTITLGEEEGLVMDTAYKNFILIQQEGEVLKIKFDQKKYNTWVKRGGYVANTSETYAAVEEGRSVSDISLALNLKKIASVKAFNANVSISTEPAYQLNYPFEAVLDSSDLRINYNERALDSLNDYYNVSTDLRYPIKVIEKNGSEVIFSFFKNIDLDLKLENDFHVVEANFRNTYKNLVIRYDDNSDITLNLSDLNKVKLVKTK